jgi:hypothetical protein
VGRGIRLAGVVLVAALALAACGGKEDTPEQTAAPAASSPTVVDDGTLAAGEKIAAPRSARAGRTPPWPTRSSS